MKKYGYVRVFTREQNVERKILANEAGRNCMEFIQYFVKSLEDFIAKR